jgi:NAD(P)-dependent dehydrogenase (short-subunit alcohol dehydrogenase family)
MADVALVTGANKGIGFEIARGLARCGMTVVVGARDVARGRGAVEALQGDGDVRALRLEVTDAGAVAAAAGWLEREFGRLDVLVNNAGISGELETQVPGRVDLAVVREVFETNVFAVVAVTEAVLPLLRRSAAGRVVNVTSGLGSLALMSDPDGRWGYLPASTAYVPSKSALNSLTVQYAKHLRGEGILVNAADPGGCATDFTAPLGRHIERTAADGAAIAVWLATLPDGGPTGGYFNDAGAVPW